MQVWVDYDGEARQLKVTLSPVKVPKPKRPLLSTAVDLSNLMADPMYIGFSSATGVVPTRHYVLGWSFHLDGPAPPLDFSKLPALTRLGPKPRSKVLDVVLPLATALLVAAVLTVIVLVIRRRRRYAEVRIGRNSLGRTGSRTRICSKPPMASRIGTSSASEGSGECTRECFRHPVRRSR